MGDRTLYNALVRTKERIATPAAWCQGQQAIDAGGVPIHDLDADNVRIACRFCVQGAARAASFRYGCFTDVINALDKAAEEAFPHLPFVTADDDPHVLINDQLGFDAVHKMLDLAIKRSVPV